MSMKQELCCKRYSLRSRLRLFNAVITPTVLYASSSWTMTAQREMLLQTSQRRMLRRILGHGRKTQIKQNWEHLETSSEGEEEQEERNEDEEDNSNSQKMEQESWVDWIKRTTQIAISEARKAQVTDWVEEQRKRKLIKCE